MSYPGSKAQAGTWQRIIGQMPPHNVYIEPFFGSGQVFWRKRRADFSYLVDLDRAVIAKVGVMAGVSSQVGDALERILAILSICIHPEHVLIYCDPPYPLSTRSGRRYYDHEMTDQQHAQLLALLLSLNSMVMISGYPCELYDVMLENWRCIRYRTRTRGKTVTECLWCNFAEPDELHDWRYAGQNFRQRFAWQRFVDRWMERVQAMPPRKRGFILHALRNVVDQRHGWRAAPADPATPWPAMGPVR